MKKMLKIFGIIAVVICLIASVVACDNASDGESVKVVAVSSGEYSSVEDALKGYVKEELAYSMVYSDGAVEDFVFAQYVSHQSKGTVANDKIKMSNEQKSGLVSAEKVAVKVKISLANSTDFSEVTQTAYVLKYGDKYKFMVSIPEVGERATNSYVKMITSTDKYENCTLNNVYRSSETDKDDEFEGREYKFTTEATNVTTYYDETRFNNRAPGGDEHSNDRKRYVVNNGNSFASVDNHFNEDQEEWTASDWGGEKIKTVKAYNAYFFEDTFSVVYTASLFIKTANGLELKLEDTRDGGYKSVNEYKITLTDDKITAIHMNSTTTWTHEDDETKVDMEVFDIDITITAFGSTTVDVPEYVTEALKQLED